MTTTSIAQTLGSVRSMLDASADNLQRLDDANARRLDASMSADRIGSAGLLRTSVSLSRNVNPLQEKAYIEQITVLEGKNTKTEFLSEVQSIVGGGDNPQKSRLVTVVDDFFQSAKLLESNSTPSMRQTFVDKAENVSDTLTRASDTITELRLEADKNLRNETINANNTIRSLFKLNNELLRSAVPIKLHDQRDVLIRDLAKHFDIKISYGNSGIAQVTSKLSGELLVSSEAYAQFAYEGVLSKDRIINNEDLPDLTISQFDRAGNTKRSTVFAGGSGDATQAFSGGKWSALIELRDKTLLEISGAIKVLTSNFTEQVNDAHNSGSPFPPKGFFESKMEVSGNQTMEWGGPFTIFAVDEIGNQLKGGAGKLNPVTIDMQNLRAAVGGTPTVAELIAELNEKLDTAPSRERAAMGAILGAGDVQIPGEYLLNNIQLKANSTVDNGRFTFELDLQGNSHFGSKIEVLSVITADDVAGTNNQDVLAADLPGDFTLGKDQNVATGQPITVTGAGANRLITMQIRITGDNGVVSKGTLSFRANDQIDVNPSWYEIVSNDIKIIKFSVI
jgi:flagellar hook-associated protein FlgK